MYRSLKTLATLFAAVLVFALTACGGGEQKFTASDVERISSGAAIRAAAAASAAEAAKADGKSVAARKQLREMGANMASTGNFRYVENCKAKPDGFSQTQAIKDFPSTAADDLYAGCVEKVYAMKAKRDEADAAKRERQQAIAAKKAAKAEKLAKLKECGHKPTQKQRDSCRADAKRHV